MNAALRLPAFDLIELGKRWWALLAGLTTAMCTSFKAEAAQALHNFTNGQHVFKMALFKANASIAGTYGAATTNYSQMGTDELGTAGGYTAGGATLTNTTPATGGTTAFWSFSSPVQWTSATFTTRGCLIYNSSSGNRSVGVWDFGGDEAIVSGTFTVNMPTNDQNNAILRFT